jgi:hypothetical protein
VHQQEIQSSLRPNKTGTKKASFPIRKWAEYEFDHAFQKIELQQKFNAQ